MIDELPNNGFYFQADEPKEQKEIKAQEKAEAVQLLPVVDSLMDWFDECIKNADSIAIARIEAEKRKLPIETVTTAYDIVRELLESKKNELRSKKLTLKNE